MISYLSNDLNKTIHLLVYLLLWHITCLYVYNYDISHACMSITMTYHMLVCLLLWHITCLYVYYYDISGPCWSWSHGSWIYNSPPMLWVRILLVANCTRYSIVWQSYSGVLVEGDVKHHNCNPIALSWLTTSSTC
jgi:hypothetical protein